VTTLTKIENYHYAKAVAALEKAGAVTKFKVHHGVLVDKVCFNTGLSIIRGSFLFWGVCDTGRYHYFRAAS
jgi:hypothetical protein